LSLPMSEANVAGLDCSILAALNNFECRLRPLFVIKNGA
jgi:hypothetical protein